jgi:hypothetical protein
VAQAEVTSEQSSIAYPPSADTPPASVGQADELGMDLRRKEPWARVGYNLDIRKDSWCVSSNMGAAAC